MKAKQKNLDQLKGKNPFLVPEGYMEGLAANIMEQLSQKASVREIEKVSLMDRIRPWLYMAAVFAGLGLFFRAFVGSEEKGTKMDSLLVRTEVPSEVVSSLQATEDEEYLEYLEERYTDYLLAEEINGAE